MMQVKNLQKKYQRTILHDLSFTLECGKVYVMKGQSGSGKTTLLNILGGIDHEYDGEVLYGGENLKDIVHEDQEGWMKQIGYVMQDSLLISNLRVMENLCMISDDEELIQSLSQQFQVMHTLTKFPEECSNGERVRIAIVRALIKHPKLILLDEPTASLDQHNAYLLSDYIEKLKSQERIIVIVTHDDCFDEIADEIFTLHYGCIASRVKQTSAIPLQSNAQIETKKGNQRIDQKLCLRKFLHTKVRWFWTIATALLILLLMITLQMSVHFHDSWEQKLLKDYPVNVLRINRLDYEKGKLDESLYPVLPFYRMKTESAEVVSFFPEELSTLSIPGAISYGVFPKQESEVLVTQGYAQSQFPALAMEQVVGQIITIDQTEFTIAGVLSENHLIWEDISHSSSYYYGLDQEKNVIFMSESAMQNFCEPQQGMDSYMISFTGSEMSERDQQLLERYSVSSYFMRVLGERSGLVQVVSYFIFAGLFILAGIIFLFMHIVIGLDLHERKKQIGYFQLFGISKRRIKRMVLIEYALKLLPAWVIALCAYLGIIVSINITYMRMPLGIFEILIASGLLLLYIALLVMLPLRNYIKKPIKELLS